MIGEDVGYFGGVFRATAGLQEKHGKTRVFDTPITECGIIGVAVGMGAYGLRPVPEIQFADYIYPALDQLVSRGGAAALSLGAASSSRRSRCARPSAAASSAARRTASRPRRIFTHVSGLKTVIPSTPYDAKGLLIAAIEDNDPVDLLRAQAHLQRPVRRPLRPPVAALVEASGGRGARPAITRIAARQGGDRARGRRR